MELDFEKILDKFRGDRQLIYVIGLLLGIFVVIFILYQIFFAGAGTEDVNKDNTDSSVIPSVTFIEQLKRDLGVLADPVFKNLKLPVELPIRISPPGRDNPFSPF